MVAFTAVFVLSVTLVRPCKFATHEILSRSAEDALTACQFPRFNSRFQLDCASALRNGFLPGTATAPLPRRRPQRGKAAPLTIRSPTTCPLRQTAMNPVRAFGGVLGTLDDKTAALAVSA